MPLNDSDRPDADRRSGPPGEPLPPVGSVAEEAAKLVEMLASAGGPWAGVGLGTPSASARQANGGASPGGPASSPDGAARSENACTCGGTTPQACRLCPVCQVISFVSSISPETIERAADLVAFAATALRDLATAQRERQDASRPAPRAEEAPQ